MLAQRGLDVLAHPRHVEDVVLQRDVRLADRPHERGRLRRCPTTRYGPWSSVLMASTRTVIGAAARAANATSAAAPASCCARGRPSSSPTSAFMRGQPRRRASETASGTCARQRAGSLTMPRSPAATSPPSKFISTTSNPDGTGSCRPLELDALEAGGDRRVEALRERQLGEQHRDVGGEPGRHSRGGPSVERRTSSGSKSTWRGSGPASPSTRSTVEPRGGACHLVHRLPHRRELEISHDAIGRSSQPVIEMSSGTRSPAARVALSAPIATRSLKQTTAVGGSCELEDRFHGAAPGLDRVGPVVDGLLVELDARGGEPGAEAALPIAARAGVGGAEDGADAAMTEPRDPAAISDAPSALSTVTASAGMPSTTRVRKVNGQPATEELARHGAVQRARRQHRAVDAAVEEPRGGRTSRLIALRRSVNSAMR